MNIAEWMKPRTNIHNITALIIVTITIIWFTTLRLIETDAQISSTITEFTHCKLVYLDIGSNIGVQIRKLFEPSRYPGAPILQIFDKYFGTDRQHKPSMCAIGMEMNPKHTMRLSSLEKHYTEECGYSVRFFKETAATTHDGWVDYWTGGNELDDGTSQYMEPQYRKSKPSRKSHALDLVGFIQREIIPTASVIVMKMDIEGSEFDILPQLIMKGAACNIDLILVETHAQLASEKQLETYRHASALAGHVPGCKIQLTELDDESYARDVDETINTC